MLDTLAERTRPMLLVDCEKLAALLKERNKVSLAEEKKSNDEVDDHILDSRIHAYEGMDIKGLRIDSVAYVESIAEDEGDDKNSETNREWIDKLKAWSIAESEKTGLSAICTTVMMETVNADGYTLEVKLSTLAGKSNTCVVRFVGGDKTRLAEFAALLLKELNFKSKSA